MTIQYTNVKIPTFHAGQKYIYRRRGKRNAVRCGRRFGKTKAIVTLSSNALLKHKKVGIFAPERKQWLEPYDEIVGCVRPIISNSNKQDGIIRTAKGGKIDFWQLTDNELAGRGREYDLILIDEAAFTKNTQMLDIWHKSIVPTTATLPHAEFWAFSTPNGDNEENFFWRVCEDPEYGFKQFHSPSWANPLVSRDWVQTERKRMHPDVFRQEIEAEFVDWSGIAFFGLDKWMGPESIPVSYPPHCDGVFAVIDTAVKTGTENDGTAVTYYARSQHHGHKLIILDYDLVQIEGAFLDEWLPGVLGRLETLAKECKAREGVKGIWIEDAQSGSVLLQKARRKRMPVQGIGGAWMQLGKDERAMAVSSYHYQSWCKISTFAFNKVITYKGATKNHLVSQVTSFRMGDKDAARRADDLLDTYTHALALTFGDSKQF